VIAAKLRRLLAIGLALLLGQAFGGKDAGTPPDLRGPVHPRITLGVGAEWAPWVIPTANGQITGFAADHLRLLGDKLGIEIGLVAGPWHEVVQAALADALLTGAVDAAIGSYALEYWRASNGVLGFGPKRMLPEAPARLGISIRKDWPELVAILDKGLAAITPAESAALHRR
jgi:ABC-type amino acid transport substrate-binding protein